MAVFPLVRTQEERQKLGALWPVHLGFESANDARQYKRRFGLPSFASTFIVAAITTVSYAAVEVVEGVRQHARRDIAQTLAALLGRVAGVVDDKS